MAPQKKNKKKEQKEELQKRNSKDVASKDETAQFIAQLKKEGMLGDIYKKIDFISSGSWVINRLIGDGSHKGVPGGFPRGYITEIFGDESCGKTTLALHAAKEAQLAGETVIYADFEHSLRTQYQYIKNIGLDVNPPKFIHLVPTNFEDGVKKIGEALIAFKPALIIIDSVTTMVPKATISASAETETQIGRQAKLVGTFLNWISKYLERYNTSLLLLNQLRSKIKTSMYETGPNEDTSGGRAPKFFATLRIRMRPKEQEKIKEKSVITGVAEDKAVNQTIKVTVVKNKLDLPFKSGPIYIAFGQGIDNIMSIISLAEGKGILKKGGAGYYEWKDPEGKYSFRIQSKQNVKKHLEENPEVLKAMQPYLIPTQDNNELKKLKEELKSKGENITDDEKKTLLKLEGMDLESDKNNEDVSSELSEEDMGAMQSLKELTGDIDTKE